MGKSRKVYAIKNGRYSVMEYDSAKKGQFGYTKIIANVPTRVEANKIAKKR